MRKVEHSLTDVGKDLDPMIKAMCEWGQKHNQGVEPDFSEAFNNSI